MRLTTGYGPGKPNIVHHADVPLDERRRRHGFGEWTIEEPVTAGRPATVRFRFTIGEEGVPVGGRLTIAWRWPFDWAAPNVTTSVKARGGEPTLDVSYHPYDGIEPYHHHVDLRLADAGLGEGDVVEVTCADWRAPTCAVREVFFLMLVDPRHDSQWSELPASEPFAIAPGEPARLEVVAPADAVVGEPFDMILRVEDEWGNPTPCDPTPRLEAEDGFDLNESRPVAAPPVTHQAVVPRSAGQFVLRASVAGMELHAESNPIRVHESAPKLRLLWGDLHSGQSLIGCGAGTLAEHYAFGRDAAGLQFLTHQANDHYVTVADWKETRRETEAFHEPGRYVPILGCEWSPFTEFGGDRNVFYNYDEPVIRRSDRFFTEPEPDPTPDVPTAPEFHAAFRELDVLVNIHVGGRMTNLDWHEPRIEKLAEVHSTHGTVEWFVRECLRRGYTVGVTAGSDGVMGRPGACRPGSRLIRNCKNGLTAVYASEPTRPAIWEALHARRCYGTTGARIALWFEVDGRPMGSEITAGRVVSGKAIVTGTAPIETIEVLRGDDVIHRENVASPSSPGERRIRVLWTGTTELGTARRQRAVWDGTLEVEGGRARSVEPIGFQTPFDGVQIEEDGTVTWRSTIAGNDAGFVMTLDESATRFRFRSEPAAFDFDLGDVLEDSRTWNAGGFDRRVTIGRAPSTDGPASAEATFEHDRGDTGERDAYWVRVTQVDREKAWSSPVYVSRKVQ